MHITGPKISLQPTDIESSIAVSSVGGTTAPLPRPAGESLRALRNRVVDPGLDRASPPFR
jgi:hypothetical protein